MGPTTRAGRLTVPADPQGGAPAPGPPVAGPADEEDPRALARDLGRLMVEPPADLAARVVASWARVPGPLGRGSPLGALYVALTYQGISYVRDSRQVGDDPERFCAEYRARFVRPIRAEPGPPPGPGYRLAAAMIEALARGATSDLVFDLSGLGAFDRAVLAKTAEIPRGQTRTYAWVAREIGRPRAVRAAGSALGRNPLPILVPCHRVVRSDGRTGNYASGPELKRALLRWEGVDLDDLGQRPGGPAGS